MKAPTLVSEARSPGPRRGRLWLGLEGGTALSWLGHQAQKRMKCDKRFATCFGRLQTAYRLGPFSSRKRRKVPNGCKKAFHPQWCSLPSDAIGLSESGTWSGECLRESAFERTVNLGPQLTPLSSDGDDLSVL